MKSYVWCLLHYHSLKYDIIEWTIYHRVNYDITCWHMISWGTNFQDDWHCLAAGPWLSTLPVLLLAWIKSTFFPCQQRILFSDTSSQWANAAFSTEESCWAQLYAKMTLQAYGGPSDSANATGKQLPWIFLTFPDFLNFAGPGATADRQCLLIMDAPDNNEFWIHAR